MVLKVNVIATHTELATTKSYKDANMEGRGKSKLANSFATSKSTKVEFFFEILKKVIN
jgi:hypothetical protein